MTFPHQNTIDGASLETLQDELEAKWNDYTEEKIDSDPDWLETNDGKLYQSLNDLRQEAGCYRLSQVIFIEESHFLTYTEEDIKDKLGSHWDSDTNWPINCIDIKKAAEQLKRDFNEVEIDGTIYFCKDQ